MQPPVTAAPRPLPAWFDDAKVGIFVHWGVYSVPAFAPVSDSSSISLNCAEWYLRKLKMPFRDRFRTREHHEATYGPDTDYHDLARLWTASAWKPREWAQEFAQAGARYVVLTAKHHDGFCLWPSDFLVFSDASVADEGPRRDIVGELAGAVRAEGLRFGVYYSLLEWYNPLYLSAKRGAYVQEIVHPQIGELVNRYRPDVLWCDGDWSHTHNHWEAEKVLRWLYDESPVRDTIVCNDRWGKDARPARLVGTYSAAVDRQRPEELLPHKWECCYTIGKSWGYNAMQTDTDYKPSAKVIADLVHTVAFGGNFLLNVGPKADGTLSPQEQRCLRDVGAWLKANGEAIYETAPLRTPRAAFAHGTAYFTQSKKRAGCTYVLLAFTSSLHSGGVAEVAVAGLDPRTRLSVAPAGRTDCTVHAVPGALRVAFPSGADASGAPIVLRISAGQQSV